MFCGQNAKFTNTSIQLDNKFFIEIFKCVSKFCVILSVQFFFGGNLEAKEEEEKKNNKNKIVLHEPK